jgi:peptidoglycan/LPS O-acetylase OafA/YrhL
MKRIPTLDGWRAVAILGVIWHHAMTFFFANEDLYNLTAARFGAFGVDVFFGLSGVLITGLLLKEWGETGSVSLKAFYTRRVFRIFPVCLVFLGVVAIAGLMHGPRELWSCLLFYRNYLPDGWLWRDTDHLWSLSVEEHFYLIWPGLLVLCGVKWGRNVAAWLAIAVGFWRLVEPQMGLHLLPEVPPHLRSDLRMDALLWGAVVAFTLNDARSREKLRLQLRFWPWLGLVVVALLSIRFYSNLTSMWLAVLIPMILAGTVLHPEWPVSRLLDSAPVAWIGRVSYSLYIWQQLLLVPGWEHPSHLWTRWPWNLAIILAVACTSYYLIETPLLRLGARLALRYSTRRRSAQSRSPIPESKMEIPAHDPA